MDRPAPCRASAPPAWPEASFAAGPAEPWEVGAERLQQAILLGRKHAEISEITVGDGTLTFEGRLGV